MVHGARYFSHSKYAQSKPNISRAYSTCFHLVAEYEHPIRDTIRHFGNPGLMFAAFQILVIMGCC